MSLRVLRTWSGRATCGSYSTSACSWVRLTATLSTPGRRPKAFSIVPVHSEQCSPPMRARIFLRPGRLDGSSLHSRSARSGAAAGDAEARPLDRGNEAVFARGRRVIKDARLAAREGHGNALYPGLAPDERLDRLSAAVAVHALDFQDQGFHSALLLMRAAEPL